MNSRSNTVRGPAAPVADALVDMSWASLNVQTDRGMRCSKRTLCDLPKNRRSSARSRVVRSLGLQAALQPQVKAEPLFGAA